MPQEETFYLLKIEERDYYIPYTAPKEEKINTKIHLHVLHVCSTSTYYTNIVPYL